MTAMHRHAARLRHVADAQHRHVDGLADLSARARLRSYAVALEMQADRLVPVELTTDDRHT